MNALLQTSDMRFAYGEVEALRGVNIRLAAGEVVAIIGPNGSGKSTLIKTLIGVLRGRGEIVWEDKPITRWSRRLLARRVAYLAQSPLFEPGQTVLEALRLGRAPYWQLFGVESMRDMQIVREIAAKLGLHDLLARRMDQLSGGQRQRVFVGRALVQEPRAILLDEPNTFLDLRHQVEMMALLRALSREQNVGVLMASHDLNLAATGADRLILLERGAVVVDAPPDKVLDPDLLTKVYGVPMERIDRDGKPPLVVPRIDFV
jgi:ABC-type cobalamin/Fe3+-siderophores transport system ATPase subunit